jgi:hypothetical protein
VNIQGWLALPRARGYGFVLGTGGSLLDSRRDTSAFGAQTERSTFLYSGSSPRSARKKADVRT